MQDNAICVIERCHVAIHELTKFRDLCMEGLGGIETRVELAMAVSNWRLAGGEADPVVEASRIQAVVQRAEYAASERERGFPILHSHCLVALWGILEAAVEDLAIARFKDDPSLKSSPEVSRVQVPIGVFMNLSEDEQLRILVSELARQAKTDLRGGINRFEPVLRLVGLGGPVDENVRSALFEYSQVRNVIVHRGGIIDRRLAAECPKYMSRAGEPLLIGPTEFEAYHDAVSKYLVELVTRLFVVRGIAREKAAQLVVEPRTDDSRGADPARDL
jgi:hypothetical protein